MPRDTARATALSQGKRMAARHEVDALLDEAGLIWRAAFYGGLDPAALDGLTPRQAFDLSTAHPGVSLGLGEALAEALARRSVPRRRHAALIWRARRRLAQRRNPADPFAANPAPWAHLWWLQRRRKS